MFKRLNLFILALLLVGQTVLGPMTATAEMMDLVEEPSGQESIEEQSIPENNEEGGEVGETLGSEEEQVVEEPIENEADLVGSDEQERQLTTKDKNESKELDEEIPSEEPTNQVQSEQPPVDTDEVEEIDEASLQKAYDTAKKAVEQALKTGKKSEIEQALELIEAVEDETLQKELAGMLNELLIRPAAEVDDEFFKLEISDVIGPNGQSYGQDNPYKKGDLFELKMEWNLLDGHTYQAGDYRTFDIPKELNLPRDFAGELKNNADEVVATYAITAEGVVTLTFTEFVENNSQINGWINIQAALNENEVVEEDGEIVIGPIGEEGEKRIPIDRSNEEKAVEKQGKPNKSYNADEIEWTVTINKTAMSFKDVVLADLLPEGTEYKAGSLKVVKQKATIGGKPVGEEEEVSVTPSVTDGQLSVPLGDISEVYTITYTTTVTDMDAKTFKNNVTFTDANLDDSKADATVTINRGEPLKKGAVKGYDPKTGIIEWYLDINFNQKDLTDATLTDSWAGSEAAGKMALVDGTVKFQEMAIDANGNATSVGDPVDPSAIGATLVKETDGFKVTGITTDKAYRVVYQTKATGRHLDGFRIQNTASFNGSTKGEGYNVGQYIGVKSAGKIDYAEKTIEWIIKVNMDEVTMNDVVITDTLGEGLTLLPDSFEVTQAGEAYAYILSDENQNPFEINLGDISKEVIIKYKTTFDADKVPNQKPTNKADVVWKDPDGNEFNKELNTNTELNKGTVDSSWKNASYNPDTKEITWTIIANYRENHYADFNIIDTPQGNQKLLSDSIRVIEMKINADGEQVEVGQINPDININGNSFDIQIGETNESYKVVYKTSVAGLEDLAQNYANKASIKDGEKLVNDVKASTQVYGDKKYGNKRGHHEPDSKTVDWSIDVNIAQEKISNLQLTDTITNNQEYLVDTIKVYEATLNTDFTLAKGSELDSSQYTLTVDGSEFTVKWQDTVDRPYIVEYSTLFFAKQGDEVGNDYKITGDGIENTDGSAENSAKTGISYMSSGGAEGTAGYLIIQKVDTTYGQAQQPIAGIQFALIDTKNNDKVLKTVTTDADGYADFGRLLFGTYELREIDVPEGYVAPKETQEITINEKFVVGESDKLDYKLEVENYKANHDVELVKRDNGDKRLKGVEFTLFTADGTEVEKKKTDVNGELAFTGLEVGNYYVQETQALNGFELDNTKHAFEITEKQHKPIQIDVVNEFIKKAVTLEKIWKDDAGETAKRPSSVTVNLFQNDMYYDTYEIKEEDGWKLTVDGLRAIDPNGKEYVYTMTEHSVLGYAPMFDSTTVTNTRTGERDITITKTWFDDQSTDRPAQIEVELTRRTFEFIVGEGYVAKGEIHPVDTYKLSEKDNWTLTLEKLPVFDEDGLPYSYELAEINVPEDYESSIEGFDITNTRVGKTSVSGEKIWKDNNAPDRPTSVEVELLKDGDVVDSQKVSKDTNWAYSFENLDQYDAQGVAYEYTISEKPVFAYDVEYVSTVEGFDVINTRVGQTGIAGAKTWVDGDGADRPESITVKLLQNDEEFAKKNVTAETDWTYEFTSLPAYDAEGIPFIYTIEEAAVEGYESTVSGYNITNLRVGETSVEGTKTWKDDNNENRPTSITVNLLQNGKQIDTQEVKAATDWKYSFEKLAVYDNKGVAYNYTISEEKVDGYETTIDGFNITNVRVGETSVEGTKTWKDDNNEDRPTSIKVNLLQNGEPIDTQEVTAATDWAYSFEKLAKYDDQGVAYEYTVNEEKVTGYETTIDGFNITNVRVGETSVAGTKTWKDDSEEARPASITVNLLQNGEVIDTQEVTAATDWTYSFKKLAAYDDQGVAYKYTISEDKVDGYETTIDSFNITNVRVGETSVEGTKTWKDDTEEARPASITVNLLQNGIVIDSQEVTAETEWKYSFEKLAEFDEAGAAYVYTISEVDVPGYNAEIDGFNITNTRTEKKSIELTKAWLDENVADRPEEITVDLFRSIEKGEKEAVETVTLTAKNDWKLVIENLPSFNQDGKAYMYEIVERAVKGYESIVDGFNIANTRAEEKSIAITKSWVGDDEKDRPSNIDVGLFRSIVDGDKEFVGTYKVTADDWELTIDKLPAFDENGKAYTYEIAEQVVGEYKTSIEGFDITNTRKTYAIGDYVWIDRNKDGIQDDNEEILAGVKVELFDKDGNKIAETTTDENGLYIFDELVSGDYKVKFTLTEEQAKKYTFTKQNAGKDSTVDSDADENGWTKEISLNEDNEHLTKDYTDQDVKASEGIDPTWDAGVIELVDITVTKHWVDKDQSVRPDTITVSLLANEKEVSKHKVTAKDDWTLTITGLEKYDEKGKEITYEITEDLVPEYRSVVEGFDITNTRKTYAIGDYVWIDRNKDGIQDDNEEILAGVTVELFDKDGKLVATTTTDENGLYIFDELESGDYKVKFTLTEEQAKKYTFTKQNAGKDSIVDSDADEKGWTKEISLNEDNAYLTKEYEDQEFKASEGIDPTWDAGVIEIIDITVTKTWQGDDEKSRPGLITVDLKQNGKAIQTVKITAEADWKYTFEKLELYDENGVAYQYEVVEHAVSGYESAITTTDTGFAITNTFIEEEKPVEPKPEETGKPSEKDPTNKGQGTLPNTATNTYNVFLAGITLFILGSVILFIRRKRSN